MTNLIMDTGNVAELLGDDEEVASSMEARTEPEGNGIEFHVAMTNWTLRDMEELIVQAAAQQIVGRLGKEPLAKMIEAKCIELVSQKCNTALEKVTAEIIDQPLIPQGFSSKETMAHQIEADRAHLADCLYDLSKHVQEQHTARMLRKASETIAATADLLSAFSDVLLQYREMNGDLEDGEECPELDFKQYRELVKRSEAAIAKATGSQA